MKIVSIGSIITNNRKIYMDIINKAKQKQKIYYNINRYLAEKK